MICRCYFQCRLDCLSHRRLVCQNMVARFLGRLAAVPCCYHQLVLHLLGAHQAPDWVFSHSGSEKHLYARAARYDFTCSFTNIYAVLYLTMRFAKTIRQIQGLQAYHAGDKLNVEVDIVLDHNTSLKDSHDLRFVTTQSRKFYQPVFFLILTWRACPELTKEQ